MKKKTNKKLSLNKQRISELSQGNMKGVNGGKPGRSKKCDDFLSKQISNCFCISNGHLCPDISDLYCVTVYNRC